MIGFVFVFLIAFVSWAVFTLSFGTLELLLGALVSFMVALVSRRLVFRGKAARFLNPVRLGAFVFYVAVFAYIEVRSHLDVAYRIVTGRIRPAMVEFPTQMRSETGKAFLGNTITLTPGTLTVKADGKLLVHLLAYKKKELPFMAFEKIGRMITE